VINNNGVAFIRWNPLHNPELASATQLYDVFREYPAGTWSKIGTTNAPDYDGIMPFYNAYPYYNFSLVVPKHNSVAKHRIMSVSEVNELLQRENIARTDIPIILTNDAPIVWNGGREGQVVEITRDSQTAGSAIYYRRIEKAQL
jgi:DNA-directed RNA polymerase subunit H (RpoH/RPB5)